MSFIEIIYFWALISVSILLINFFTRILGINIISKVSSIIINDNHWKILIIIDIIINTIIRPFLEEIVFRGVIMNNLRKYGIRVAIIINSLLFGLSHYNVEMIIPAFLTGIIFSYVACKYSIKYSILIHFLLNTITQILQVIILSKIEMSIVVFGLFLLFLIIFLLIFFIIGLAKGRYKEIFFILKLNVEDRKKLVEFVKNDFLYMLIIFVIVISNFLFNYKIF